jgi:TonB-linked SusC/RagA family outer membrane protein
MVGHRILNKKLIKMKKRYIQILIFLCLVILFSATTISAQTTESVNKRTIESVVKDFEGNPIEGALIYGNEGAVVAKTDAYGRFTILLPERSALLIESKGYKSIFYRAGEYDHLREFSLMASEFLYGEDDDVNLAFRKTKSGNVVNSVSVLNPDEIRQYDDIQSIAGALSGRVPGLLGSGNLRGTGGVLFIVDGFPRDINTINLSEIEQITVLKDVNSAIMYGNAAANGVVLITTKRGQAHKRQVSVSGYYGVSTPAALPKFLSSADYARLYNEARINDGLAPQYDSAAIANYQFGNPYRYPDIDYYSDQYLRSYKPYSRVMAAFAGGNEVTTYYTNLGWEQSGDLINFGAGEAAKQNIFNIRGNVDFNVNHWIKSSLDAVAVLNNNQGPVVDYWSAASTLRPNQIAPLIPISLIDPDNALLNARKTDVNGQYLLGGSAANLSNPIADIYSGGVNEVVQRTFSINNRVSIDLDRVTKGLTFNTNGSFDLYSRYHQSINNQYAVYSPTWSSEDSVTWLSQHGLDRRPGTQNVGNAYYQRRFGFYGLMDYDRIFDQVHHITGSLLAYGNYSKVQNVFQGDKHAHLGFRLGYGFKNRYLVDFSSAYVNSVKLPEGNRAAFSPSLGLAWVISSEEFMSGTSAIDYLKLRLSGGIMHTDAGIGSYYLYNNVYSRSSTYHWHDRTWGNSSTVSNNLDNSQLFFEQRKEINLGFESILFDHMLSVDANIFTSRRSNQLTRPQTIYPSFYSHFIPYVNFEEYAYKGAELGLSLNQNIGNVSFILGANALYADSEVLIRDEVYADSYQYRAGRPVDAIFGLIADGFFMDEDDIANHADQAFGSVRPGDIKYLDQNNDGLVDANDEIQIGRWQAPFSYGLNLRVSYKKLTFFALGTGRVGADSFMSGNYYRVDGNLKYSEVVLDRWTEETKTTATYPRLSSVSNSNNSRNSTFWMYRDNYFTLDRVQLTYDMPDAVSQRLRMQNLSFYVNGSYLMTISKHKDIKELRVGSEPFYRSFSLGIKTQF